jgi:RNase H-like domain found in reverse transcriptase/Reverse transcriptase (RNA-dependent DNA polymerase)/Integrase zinc binding domain/Aspartyl protease
VEHKAAIDELRLLRLGFINILRSGPSLLHIILEINGLPTIVLLDTGASLSVCSETFASTLQKTTCPPLQLKGIAGSSRTDSVVNVQILLDGLIVNQDVHPVTGLTDTLLLGNDFLIANPSYISYHTHSVRFGDTEYPIFFSKKEARAHLKAHKIFHISPSILTHTKPNTSDSSYDCPSLKVRVQDTMTTSPYGYEKIGVTVDLKECYDLDSYYVFEWDPKFLEQHSVLGPGLLVRPTELDYIILSSMGIPQKIRANTCIGYLTPVDEIHQVMHTKHSPLLKKENIKIRRKNKMTKEQLAKIKIASDLTPSQQASIRNLIGQFGDCFTFDDENLSDLGSLVDGYEHPNDTGVRLSVKSFKPLYQKPYPLSIAERKILQETIDKFERAGLLERKHCSFTSPMLLVKKPDLTRRLVCDFRKINALVLDEQQTILPKINELWEILSGFQYVSKTDFAHGFFQLKLDKRDRKYCGTAFPDGTVEWKVLPQGLNCSPSIFQQAMRRVFYDILYSFAFCYIDDIIIFSKSFDLHLIHLEQYFLRLRKHNLTLSWKKSSFAMGLILILGYIISREGIKTDPEKVSAITSMPSPEDITQTRSFMGMVSYYRRFVKNFASRARAIFNTIKDCNQPFKWTEAAEASFQDLKQALISSPILQPFNPDYDNYLFCDASNYAIGAVLQQKPPSGPMTVVCYISRGMTHAETSYGISEKECLAIIYAVKKLREFLYAKKLTIVTDHCALCSLLRLKTSSNARLTRWALELSGYQIDVRYQAGHLHTVADCLSRLVNLSDKPAKTPTPHMVNFLFPSDHRSLLVTAQQNDPLIQSLRRRRSTDKSLQRCFTEVNSLLYKLDRHSGRPRLVVPESFVPKLLNAYHDHEGSGHIGRDKLQIRINRNFYWPKMYEHIRIYCQSCIICNKIKSRNRYPPGTPMRSHEIVDNVWNRVYFDIIGPLPKSSQQQHQFIYVCICALSRYCEAMSFRAYNSKNVALFLLNKIAFRHGVPFEIVWDNASQHKSALIKELTKRLEIVPIFTTTFTSAGASIVERANRSIQQILASYVTTVNTDWSYYLQSAVFALNTTIHSSTSFSSFYLLHGRHPRIPIDLGITLEGLPPNYLENLQKAREKVKFALLQAQDKNRIKYERVHDFVKFHTGELVMIQRRPDEYSTGSSRKLTGPFKGPFRITQLLSNQTVQISPITPPYYVEKVHISKLRPLLPRPAYLQDDSGSLPVLTPNVQPAPVNPPPVVSAPTHEQRRSESLPLAMVDEIPSPTDLYPPSAIELDPVSSPATSPAPLRRSTRKRVPTVRFNL